MKYILFDLDGTLLNSLDDLHCSINWALQQHHLPLRTLSEIRSFVGNGVRKLAERALPEGSSSQLMEEVFADFKTYYIKHCMDMTRPYEGIPELLHELKEKGYKMGIVSNKMQAGVTELYHKFFEDTVDVAVGERPGLRTKPAPDLALAALEELGAKAEETLYVGDSDVDIQTATASGVDIVSVTWGFRDQAFLLAHGAKKLINSPMELMSLLD